MPISILALAEMMNGANLVASKDKKTGEHSSGFLLSQIDYQ